MEPSFESYLVISQATMQAGNQAGVQAGNQAGKQAGRLDQLSLLYSHSSEVLEHRSVCHSE
jgi:hypothetical protein